MNRRETLKSAVLSGTITAVVTWLVKKSTTLENTESGDTPTP